MAQVEKDLGRSLIWTAVNHHNTEHSHVHVVVRGVDRNGKEVRFPRDYIKEDMQARAAQIMTRELGVRTEFDIARQRSVEIGQERLTSIHRRLARLVPRTGAFWSPRSRSFIPRTVPRSSAGSAPSRRLGWPAGVPRGHGNWPRVGRNR